MAFFGVVGYLASVTGLVGACSFGLQLLITQPELGGPKKRSTPKRDTVRQSTGVSIMATL